MENDVKLPLKSFRLHPFLAHLIINHDVDTESKTDFTYQSILISWRLKHIYIHFLTH